MRSPLLEHDLALAVDTVCGADEAGRGCLAGPLVAAACTLRPAELAGQSLELVHDSKKLTPARRAALLPLILAAAERVSVQVIAPAEIDRQGVHQCNLQALAAAVVQAAPAEITLIDHYPLPAGSPPHRSITRGDATSLAIAAASVIAKETRDRIMALAAEQYPQYGFDRHAGYGTKAHQQAIERHGPTPLHRMSYNAACYARWR